VAYVGGRLAHPGQQPAPELGLPQQVVVEVTAGTAGTVGGAALAPVCDQRRPLHGVGRVEAGEAARDGVAAVATQLGVVALEAVAEVGGEGRAPRFVDAGIDRLQQRPDQPVGVPGVVAVAAEQHRDQRSGVEEPDARADAVPTARPGPKAVGEPLGQPPLDALGRDHHDLLGERVVEGCRHQLTEGVGELVGARCAVQVEGHRGRG
jgi:hypothetical protein